MTQEREEMNAASDEGDSITIGGDSNDMMAFMSEVMAARFQGQLMREGRKNEIKFISRHR
jgi:hypothetical protein